jgi:anti-sigma B factor antagonist
MQIQVDRTGSRSVVHLSGDIDLSSSPRLRETLLDLLQKRRQELVVVNMERVQHVDSSCIASLVEGLQEARQHNARFVLVGLRESTRNLLELTHLLQTFEIRPTVEDALA